MTPLASLIKQHADAQVFGPSPYAQMKTAGFLVTAAAEAGYEIVVTKLQACGYLLSLRPLPARRVSTKPIGTVVRPGTNSKQTTKQQNHA